ncbi:rho guanine nucleotide exchange factor 7 isoform X2 [Biomphalaria glabrata]|uniref:Rho guanine nucleotide exchange factor 7 isoform X2 n=1 Tax=Biomphalaria glabrata TaxID=6526 RepID=A0A9W2YYX2_BIOGL|nr:rho guanine nucleotide exchange factor 7 isoform X2 [Biomphalaria glabrata]
MEWSNNEYPTEYIDIVNEINDFIASLDAPPLDNHTNELVGNAHRGNTFGQHVEGGYPDISWSPRSRHGSGEKSGAVVQKEEDASDKTMPFPLLEENPYDYIGSDRSRSTDFGDSDYSDISMVSNETADSDSGCYSHYQFPRSDTLAVQRDVSGLTSSPVKLASSCPSNFSSSFSSSPHSLSGHVRASPLIAQSSSSPRHVQHQFGYSSVRPQSPDRLSAEYHCEPFLDSVDQKFHQVGSSAHSLAASLSQAPQWNPADHHDYQEPSNIPKIPESPVPQRRSPTKANKPSDHNPNPLSTSPSIHSESAGLKVSNEAVRDNVYSVISKNTPAKLNINNRWPPSNQASDPLLQSQTGPKASNLTTPPKQRDNKFKDPSSEKVENSPRQQPVNKVPDLSVLISELRSASPRSDLSPNSKFTACAHSERGPLPSTPGQCQKPSANTDQQIQADKVDPKPAISKRADPEGHTLDRQSRSAKQLSGRSQRSESQSPISLHRKGTSGTAHKHLANGGRCKSESPEHDYEPIENLLELEVPATPRPQTKFPHFQGQKTMAESGGQQPKHVKAIHSFKGSNNDELCFKKGDIITVTQSWDEGWWEGTLNGRTGWFPSNYVKEIKGEVSYKNKTGDVPVYKRESMQLYHNVVLKNVIETEKTHVTEMIKVLQMYIKPIEPTNILTPPEYTLLIGNFEEIIAFQQSFLAALEECEKLPPYQRRIGGIFMQFAQSIKELYQSYCANHPKAVSIVQKKREELSKFIESQGATAPGAQTLITILSKPFTRLEKYPSLLKELERHVEESHPDRGDTQRAIEVYKTINNSCVEIRRLKEMEHEIVTSVIQGWEGEEIAKLGEVVHLSQVKMVTQTGEKFERIFVLFPSCLVMLSMTPRLSSYQYEGKIPLSGLTSNPCESADVSQNAFEISGPMIEKITVLCGTKGEVTAWLDILHQTLTQSVNPAPSSKPQSLQVHMISTSQPSVSTVVSAKTAQISNNPPKAPPPQFPLSTKPSSVWSLTCLRPSPPTRPTLMCRDEVLKSPRAARKTTNKRKPDDPKVYNEDAFILQVIEAYCNSVKTRHTVNSYKIEGAKKQLSEEGKAILNSPQILLAEEEKIIDETEQQERTVVDTVYALQDRVRELEQEQRKIKQELEEERRCRKKLETLVRQQLIKTNIVDGVQDCVS